MASRSWWAQGVAVAYEQHIGRREPGQVADGTFEASVNKTMEGTMDQAMKAGIDLFDGRKEFSNQAIVKAPATTETDKRRHWGCGLEDGSRVSVDVYEKSPGKVNLSVTHTKLASSELMERWRAYWKVLTAAH